MWTIIYGIARIVRVRLLVRSKEIVKSIRKEMVMEYLKRNRKTKNTDNILSFSQPIRNHNKWNVLYFVAFLLLAGFVVLNMLVGVVVENFQKCRDIIEKDRLAEKEKEREKEQARNRQSGKIAQRHKINQS